MKGFFSLRMAWCAAILFGVSACRSPARVPDPQETAPPAEKNAAAAPAHSLPDAAAWAPQIDACTDLGISCRAAAALDVQLRQIPRGARFAFLLQLLGHPSPRVAAYALYRMYPFRQRAELLPFLDRILSASRDPLLLKLAAALALMSPSSQGAALFMRHYEHFPQSVRNELAWTVRMNYTHLDVAFLQKLREGESPLLRATALEIETMHSDSPEALLSCVRALGPDAASCALSLARAPLPDSGVKVEALIGELLAQAAASRRLLALPPELASAVELMHGQKRIDTQKASELLEKMLSSRQLEDAVRAQAAFSLGRVKGRDAIGVLQRFRRDPRTKVGYAARRAIYLLEREP